MRHRSIESADRPARELPQVGLPGKFTLVALLLVAAMACRSGPVVGSAKAKGGSLQVDVTEDERETRFIVAIEDLKHGVRTYTGSYSSAHRLIVQWDETAVLWIYSSDVGVFTAEASTGWVARPYDIDAGGRTPPPAVKAKIDEVVAMRPRNR